MRFGSVMIGLGGAVLGIAAGAGAQSNYFPAAQVYRQPPSPHYQPYMVDALQALHHARGMLDSSSADKGGHRVRAMALVDQAIGETQAGIDYANTH